MVTGSKHYTHRTTIKSFRGYVVLAGRWRRRMSQNSSNCTMRWKRRTMRKHIQLTSSHQPSHRQVENGGALPTPPMKRSLGASWATWTPSTDHEGADDRDQSKRLGLERQQAIRIIQASTIINHTWSRIWPMPTSRPGSTVTLENRCPSQ